MPAPAWLRLLTSHKRETQRAIGEAVAADLLGDGDGESLATLVNKRQVARLAGVNPKTAHRYLADSSAVGESLLAAWAAEVDGIVSANLRTYLVATEQMAGAAPAEALAILRAAITRDMVDYVPGDGGRSVLDRLFYLIMGIARFDDPDDDLAVGFRDLIAYEQSRYLVVYERLCELFGRRPIGSLTDLQLAVNVALEGYRLRFITGSAVADAQLVSETTLRLLWAFTRPSEGEDIDLATELFQPSGPAHPRGEARVVGDRETLYATVVDAMERLRPDETLRHCALHGAMTEDGPVRAVASPMRTAQRRHLDAGGSVERIAAFHDLAALDAHLDWLQARFASAPAACRLTSYALIGPDLPPGLAPLVVGERFAALGREDRSGGIAEGLVFTSSAGVAFVERTFAAAAADALALCSPDGINERAVGRARRALQAAGHR